jgi:hypothetical protein
MTTNRSRVRVARNFIDRYGVGRFRELLAALAQGDSGQEIAERFDVSRERVRQWKNTFGEVVTLYQVHSDVRRLLESVGAEPPPEPEAMELDILL